jgi:hypothetical protein
MRPPRVMITDKLASYGAAKREIMPSIEHRHHKGLNNRAENSHQPTRRRERQMKQFKSPGHAQRFLSAHDQINNLFRLRRDHVTAAEHKSFPEPNIPRLGRNLPYRLPIKFSGTIVRRSRPANPTRQVDGADLCHVDPNGIGGYTAPTPRQMPRYVNPNGAGGYVQTPGQLPTYVQPNGPARPCVWFNCR